MEEISKTFREIYKGKKVLVTGNTGFKGSWLSVWLLKLGADVYGISKDIPTNPSMFEKLNLKEKITYFNEDVRNLTGISSIIEKIKPDFVFHLAAQPIVSISYTNPVETISSNVIGTTNIMEALRISNHKCTAIIITSDKCYDNIESVWGYRENDALGGKDIYSGSKGAAELIIKSYYNSFFSSTKSNVTIAAVRAGNVIGGGDWALDRIVPDCMRAWNENKVVEIRSPKSTRPWQHVLEPLSGYLNVGQQLYMDNSLNGETLNFGPKSEYNFTVEELLKDLSKIWHFENPLDAYQITDNIEFHEAGLLKLNCDKALFLFKWLPALEYSDVIEYTGNWYYNYYRKNVDMFKFTIEQIYNYEEQATKKELLWTK